MTLELQYQSDSFALFTDWQNPFTDGIHGDWRKQVRYALSKPENHLKLDQKMSALKPCILVYSKIKEDKKLYLKKSGLNDATVCVISSSGEHLLTPWMIIHNIGHTMISHNMYIKKEIMKIIGLTNHDDSIIEIQKELVDCKSSRDMLIPNVNELIYELFTTWFWHGSTKSPKNELRNYCNAAFPILIDKFRNKIFWHKYRHPIKKQKSIDWIEQLVTDLEDIRYVPGVPGFSSKILKNRTL